MYNSIYYYSNMNAIFSYDFHNNSSSMNEQCEIRSFTQDNTDIDVYMLLFCYLLSCYMATFYMYKYGVFNVDVDDDTDVSVKNIETYEDMYYDSFNSLESRDLDDTQIQNMINNIIWENIHKLINLVYPLEGRQFVAREGFWLPI